MRGFDDFERAFDDLWPRSYRLARRIVGEREAAEDVAAEAMARLYSHWRRVGRLAWRDAWVLRVTTNLALDVVRRKPAVVASPVAHDEHAAALDRIALAPALASLPVRQREVVVLRYLADVSEADVAAALGLAPGTVKSHLHRGLRAMREGLGAPMEEEIRG